MNINKTASWEPEIGARCCQLWRLEIWPKTSFHLRFVMERLKTLMKQCMTKSLCDVSWVSRWWFQTCFIFTPIWGRLPFWLIFSDGLKPSTRYFYRLKPQSTTLGNTLCFCCLQYCRDVTRWNHGVGWCRLVFQQWCAVTVCVRDAPVIAVVP